MVRSCPGLSRGSQTTWRGTVEGTRLLAFDPGYNAWREVAAGAAGAAAPAAVSWATSDPALAARLPAGEQREIALAVTPAAPNGSGSAVVVTDYIELTVRYRLSP